MLTFEEAVARREKDKRTLGGMFLKKAKEDGNKTAVFDFMSGELPRIRLAGAASVLGEHFNLAPDEQRVGVLLPPGAGGSMVNLSLALMWTENNNKRKWNIPYNKRWTEAG